MERAQLESDASNLLVDGCPAITREREREKEIDLARGNM